MVLLRECHKQTIISIDRWYYCCNKTAIVSTIKLVQVNIFSIPIFPVDSDMHKQTTMLSNGSAFWFPWIRQAMLMQLTFDDCWFYIEFSPAVFCRDCHNFISETSCHGEQVVERRWRCSPIMFDPWGMVRSLLHCSYLIGCVTCCCLESDGRLAQIVVMWYSLCAPASVLQGNELIILDASEPGCLTSQFVCDIANQFREPIVSSTAILNPAAIFIPGVTPWMLCQA